MSVPLAPDPQLVKSMSLTVIEQPKNLPKKAMVQMGMMYPHVIPSLSSPKLVLKPEGMKYWRGAHMNNAQGSDESNLLTKGMNTRFSTRAIEQPYVSPMKHLGALANFPSSTRPALVYSSLSAHAH